jgi:UDP-arabinose 4-epimerase
MRCGLSGWRHQGCHRHLTWRAMLRRFPAFWFPSPVTRIPHAASRIPYPAPRLPHPVSIKNVLNTMNILVTGGAGYIGSHTSKVLAATGHTPVVVDNLANGHEWAVKWGPFERGDLSDRRWLADVFRRHRIDAVVHFAASAYVGESMTHPRRYFHNNTVNSLQLLDAMLDAGVKDIVFSSTCATYGIPQRLPLDETHPQAPVNPYGESKLCVERILHWYGQAYGLRWTALRYFNAAGADPDGEIGEVHDPETHLIPLVIGAALGTGPPVNVFGTDYPTTDGTAIRDYIHVMDLADAHVRALDYLGNGGESTALNLGTGEGHSVRAVIEAVEKVGGRPVPSLDSPRRPGDPLSLVADAARARTVLKWTPRYPNLQTIVEHAWRWHSSGRRLAAGG